MRLRGVELHNFKRFDDFNLDLTDSQTGHGRDNTLIVGDNGSGKSTILQAIALALGIATRRLYRPDELNWPGFVPDRIGTTPGRPCRVTLDVEFETAELAATTELARRLNALRPVTNFVNPGDSLRVRLMWEGGPATCGTAAELFQFRGRDYARQLVAAGNAAFTEFENVGSVFWYHQHRTATSLYEPNGSVPGSTTLREKLVQWYHWHDQLERTGVPIPQGRRDFYSELEKQYQRVFPDRRFVGVAPRPGLSAAPLGQDFWFLLNDGRSDYEMGEMSSGEESVFPFLFDFMYWRIHRSIVLLDEVELHLHPPLQQFLLRTLPNLGTENQFILTTHSQEVLSVVPPENVVRIEGR